MGHRQIRGIAINRCHGGHGIYYHALLTLFLPDKDLVLVHTYWDVFLIERERGTFSNVGFFYWFDLLTGTALPPGKRQRFD
jgi:hypothetical protein